VVVVVRGPRGRKERLFLREVIAWGIEEQNLNGLTIMICWPMG